MINRLVFGICDYSSLVISADKVRINQTDVFVEQTLSSFAAFVHRMVKNILNERVHILLPQPRTIA